MRLPIRSIGDNVLRQSALAITEIDDDTRKLADDMLDTLRHSGGIGLAAPQVGQSVRLIVYDVGRPRFLANPVVIESSGSEIFEEGCLSVPSQTKIINRPSQVLVRAIDLASGEITLFETGGIEARVLQHEIDHLDGILMVDYT